MRVGRPWPRQVLPARGNGLQGGRHVWASKARERDRGKTTAMIMGEGLCLDLGLCFKQDYELGREWRRQGHSCHVPSSPEPSVSANDAAQTEWRNSGLNRTTRWDLLGQPSQRGPLTACTFEGSSSSSLATTQPASSITPGRLMYLTRPLSCTFRVMIIFITCLPETIGQSSPGTGTQSH